MKKKAQDRFNLHEALANGAYDHAFICTYTFEPVFFEEYCLDKFNTLHSNANLTVIVDQKQYEQALLGPETQRPKQANLRYLLHPISVPGVFHPKLVLLASRRRGKFIFGSANFTRSGLTGNAELVGCYEYEEGKKEEALPLFQAAFNIIASISQRWPSNALTSSLNALTRDAVWLSTANEMPAQSGYELWNNLETPLWKQLIHKTSASPKTVYVLSRYFDAQPTLLDRVMSDLHPQKIKIFTQNAITSLTKEWLRHPLIEKGVAEIYLATFGDGEHSQPLHGKAIIFDAGEKCVFAYGSANFTSAALLKTATNGNAEMVMVFDNLATKDFQPEVFCDPNNNAELLKSEDVLSTARRDEALPAASTHEVRLLEATLKELRLEVRLENPRRISFDRLTATIIFSADTQSVIDLHPDGQNVYIAGISYNLAQRLGRSSSVVVLEAFINGLRIAGSNHLLVTNLLDIKTGQSVARQRHVRDAEQSADQFFAVLRDLIMSSDDDALKDFLTYCNIPFVSARRPYFATGLSAEWDLNAEMRTLGERNLQTFNYLHDAAVDFVDRHHRKLKRHAKQRELEGIANFLHLFRAVVGVLHNQSVRLVTGLEAKRDPLTAEEWGECRQHFDNYYGRFKQIVDCLWTEYTAALLKEHLLQAIQERFAPDMEAIHSLCHNMLGFRDRIEKLRVARLRIHRRTEPPAYFHCVFNELQWQKYSRDVQSKLANVEKTVCSQILI